MCQCGLVEVLYETRKKWECDLLSSIGRMVQPIQFLLLTILWTYCSHSAFQVHVIQQERLQQFILNILMLNNSGQNLFLIGILDMAFWYHGNHQAAGVPLKQKTTLGARAAMSRWCSPGIIMAIRLFLPHLLIITQSQQASLFLQPQLMQDGH